MNQSKYHFRLSRSRNYALQASGLFLAAVLALVGFASSAHAQTPPTVNGLFYGDGDDGRYELYGTSAEGSELYSYLDNDTLYVAMVISQNVNDLVCSPKPNSAYTGSANPPWNQHRSCKRASDSEFAAFSLTCNGTTYNWQQALGCATEAGPPQNTWESSPTCGPSSDEEFWPDEIIDASTSWVANITSYQDTYEYTASWPPADLPWNLYAGSIELGEKDLGWKSPFTSTDEDNVQAVQGYPEFTSYAQLLPGQSSTLGWEWSVVYEWSADVSDCDDASVAFWPTASHHSPPKSGAQDEPWYDWGDLPDTYPTISADDGPRHLLVAGGPTLGIVVDPEQDGAPSVPADGDDNSAADDEDGVSVLPAITTTSDTVDFVVSVLNSTGNAATLACWIDFNINGSFLDVGERAEATVNSAAGQQSIPLTFTGFDPPLEGDTYLRCRIANAAGEVALPTGSAATGEVEDYPVSTTNTTLAVTISYFLAQRDGNAVGFIWQTATETGNAGFNVLAETDNHLVQLNGDLIQSKVIDSVSPTDYAFQASSSATIFYIEEVSINGRTNRAGPFVLGASSGAHIGNDVESSPMIWLPMVRN